MYICPDLKRWLMWISQLYATHKVIFSFSFGDYF